MKRPIENYREAFIEKYSHNYNQEIRDCLLLIDCFFLHRYNVLNDDTVNELAAIANVHPSYIGRLLIEDQKEDDIIREQAAKNIVIQLDNNVFNKDNIQDLTKEEVIEIVESKVKKKRKIK